MGKSQPPNGVRDDLTDRAGLHFLTTVSGKTTGEPKVPLEGTHDGAGVPAQGLFFGGMWLVLLAVTFMVRTEWAEFHGYLLMSLGALVLVCRPAAKVPAAWWALAAVFVVAGAMAFLPAGWFYYPEWRRNFDAIGIATGPLVAIQSKPAVEQYVVFAITLFVGIWMAGFRANGFNLRLWSLAFTAGVAGYAIVSKILWDQDLAAGKGIFGEHYGFFRNRNHTATYLVMGALCGFGGVVQCARDKRFGLMALFLVPTGVCFWALVGLSVSRAGPVLLVAGLLAWLVLLGIRYLGRNEVVALAVLAIAGAALFLAKPSRVKDRLFGLASSAEAVVSAGKAGDGGADGPDLLANLSQLDNRVSIGLDALPMIRDFKWTGVGAGQFVSIFPQYRNRAAVSNDYFNKHPENDWLWMACEAGVPATLALAGITVLAVATGWRAVRAGRERALRGACLIAALVVPIHGLMDVPGHQITLALSACWLFAMALGSRGGDGASCLPSAWWPRIQALFILGAGWTFLNGGWWGIGRPATHASTVALEKAQAAYPENLKPFEEAWRNQSDYQPSPENDPMEKSIRELERELAVAPLDRHVMRFQALMASSYWNKTELIDRNFRWERELEPSWIAILIWQAETWSHLEPGRSDALIKEAIRRAERIDSIQPGTRFSKAATIAKIREYLNYTPDFRKAVSEAAFE